jgi:hypothetical protein
VLRTLASGYPLHHLRARLRTSGASVGRYGGSASIPLAEGRAFPLAKNAQTLPQYELVP